jgi:cytochrome c oxidase assembly protein subunit 15
VRRLAWILVGTILTQAVLGGLRVLLDSSNTHWSTNMVALSLRVAHALMAEITILLWVTLAMALSRGWVVRGVGAKLVAPGVRRWGHVACAVIFLQIFLGAVMRHGGYALVIPTFPASTLDGALLPAGWSWPVAVNFAHRVGACLVTVAILGLAASVYRDAAARRQLGSWMTMILLVVTVQIGLGAEVIWSNKNANVATAHLLTGAFLLASTWLLTFQSYRSKWWPPEAA